MSEKDYDTLLAEVLPWLENGDRKELAGQLNLNADYVSKCLRMNGPNRSWKVLRAAAIKAAKNKAETDRARAELKRMGA